MRVLLKNNWYTAQGRFRPGPNGEITENVPDELRDQLPSTAVEVDKDGEPVKGKKAPAEPSAKAAAKPK